MPTDPLALPTAAELDDIDKQIHVSHFGRIVELSPADYTTLITAARLVGPLMAELKAWEAIHNAPVDADMMPLWNALAQAKNNRDAALAAAGVKMGGTR